MLSITAHGTAMILRLLTFLRSIDQLVQNYRVHVYAAFLPLLAFTGWALLSGRMTIVEASLMMIAVLSGLMINRRAQLQPTISAQALASSQGLADAAGTSIEAQMQLDAANDRAALERKAGHDITPTPVPTSSEDQLTGLANRSAFKSQISAMPSSQKSGCFVLLNIDHLTHVNERFGVIGGDAVLKDFGARLSGQFRRIDHVARWGGDNFVVLLQGCSEDEAGWTLSRIAAQMREHPIAQLDSGPISFSAGVCRWRGEAIETIIDRANQALQQAKQSGRDQICRASHLQPVRRNNQIAL